MSESSLLSSLSNWHAETRHRAIGVANDISRIVGKISNKMAITNDISSRIIRDLLESQSIRTAFHVPDGGVNIGSIGTSHPHYLWYEALWGRRCSHFIRSLAKGLRIDCNPKDEKLVETLSNTAVVLLDFGNRKRRKLDDLQSAFKEGHGVTNFHNTHFDPRLFSSLIFFEKLQNQINKLRNGESYIEDKIIGRLDLTRAESLEHSLLEIIREEFSIYTNNGRAKNGVLNDESTIWWAARILARYTRSPILLRKPNEKEEHIELSDLLNNLLGWAKNDKLHYPDFNMALTEATPEIHCKLKTLLYIVLNAIEFTELHEIRETHMLGTCRDAIDWGLVEARKEWHGYLPNHAYFIGLTLEVLARWKNDHHIWENIQNEFSVAGNGNWSGFHPKTWFAECLTLGSTYTLNQLIDNEKWIEQRIMVQFSPLKWRLDLNRISPDLRQSILDCENAEMAERKK